MKHRLIIFAVAGFSVASASPATAGEIFGGIYKHDVKLPTDLSGRESGFDLQLGWRGDGILHTPLQPYIFGALNTAGDTSYAAAGLSARLGLGGVYVRPGLGLAIHNGSAAKYDIPGSNRIQFGSRILFEPEIGIGTHVAPLVTVEASWVHLSHAQLFAQQNPGMDNLGVRVNVALP